MRRGELCKLKWSDVHLEDGYLMLKGAITKNRKSRIVPLSLRAKRILATQPKRSAFVFAVTPEAIKSAFRRARARVGIVDLRKHDLRHEATSRLFVETVGGHGQDEPDSEEWSTKTVHPAHCYDDT